MITPDPSEPVLPESPTASVIATSVGRAIANQLNFYQATVAGGTALAFNWVRGVGSVANAGNSVRKV